MTDAEEPEDAGHAPVPPDLLELFEILEYQRLKKEEDERNE